MFLDSSLTPIPHQALCGSDPTRPPAAVRTGPSSSCFGCPFLSGSPRPISPYKNNPRYSTLMEYLGAGLRQMCAIKIKRTQSDAHNLFHYFLRNEAEPYVTQRLFSTSEVSDFQISTAGRISGSISGAPLWSALPEWKTCGRIDATNTTWAKVIKKM